MKSTAAPPKTLNKQVGANVRQAREAAGKTQLALAHEIGWAGDDAGAQISLYESGQKEPRISTLTRIAAALGVSIDVLLKTK